MRNQRILAADLAVMQAKLSALRFHAERLRDAALNAAAGTTAESRIFAAHKLAEDVLSAITNMPALYAVPADEV